MELAVNKKARFNYEIIEDFEAGIALQGSEVKSVRLKKINIQEAYATFKRHELFLINARIEPYEKATIFNHDPVQPRKLLMHRKELDKLRGKVQLKGWVLIPLKVYLKKRTIKILIGLGKSKKKFDKRQTIKERDVKIEMGREMKRFK